MKKNNEREIFKVLNFGRKFRNRKIMAIISPGYHFTILKKIPSFKYKVKCKVKLFNSVSPQIGLYPGMNEFCRI